MPSGQEVYQQPLERQMSRQGSRWTTRRCSVLRKQAVPELSEYANLYLRVSRNGSVAAATAF
jgi:hypothetical protein